MNSDSDSHGWRFTSMSWTVTAMWPQLGRCNRSRETPRRDCGRVRVSGSNGSGSFSVMVPEYVSG